LKLVRCRKEDKISYQKKEAQFGKRFKKNLIGGDTPTMDRREQDVGAEYSMDKSSRVRKGRRGKRQTRSRTQRAELSLYGPSKKNENDYTQEPQMN